MIMKIVADKYIPFLEGVFEPYAEVVYIDGRAISREDLIDADALIIRTRTKCNAELLDGTNVKIIATATIGTDHIDLDYCAEKGIMVHNAEGCNAGGVMQYVFSALYGVAARKAIKLEGYNFGIVGVGNVGRKVEAMARYLGFNVLRCDPPRAEAEGEDGFCSLDYLLSNSQIVTMHVPLNESTRGMADEEFFLKMQLGTIFINAARGEVLVDDCDVRKWKLDQLRSSIGTATQDVFLFSDTVEGNIAFGNQELTIDEVKDFAARAAAGNFCEKLADGYDTIIGERGVGLSGGQRQRIALARAMAVRPSILVMDDTTSAVDSETEHYIQQQLRELPYDCTKFIIAQRISSMRDADLILVIKDGRIAERGTHDELVKLHGYYYQTYALQNDLPTEEEAI